MSERNLQAVTYSRHKSLTWSKPLNYRWTAGEVVCPLNANEMLATCMSMAIAFVKGAEGYMLVAILGVGAGRNLMLASDDSWDVRYLPNCYRSYPFMLARNENQDLVLCVEEGSDLISADESGQKFFVAEGQPTTEVTGIFNTLLELDKQRTLTQSICAVYEKHELIEPWKIQLKEGESLKEFEGLYNINEAKLKSLEPDVIVELHRSGALLGAYAQLLSMQHLSTMIEAAAVRAARGAGFVKPPKPAAMKDFDDGSGIISFDKLFGAY